MDVDRGALPGGLVFVNYRARDQPVAAAAIHGDLARRFGAGRVFRDCVSMQAGQHYPTEVRAALENAAVLVAVIGPRWLTLTEEHSPTRLIDRDRDWVRMEIADALRRGISVVPVLLKETPESAEPLAPEDLPGNIRALATLQAFELSQRRFGADLDRLAQRLLQLAPHLAVPPSAALVARDTSGARPTNAAPPGAAPADAFFDLVEAFFAVPAVRDQHSRSVLLTMLRPELAAAVPHHATDRLHVIALLRTCLHYADGLDQLITAASRLGMSPADERHLRVLTDRFLSTNMDRI